MVCLVVGHIGEQEEVAIAMVELNLGSRDVVVVEIQVGEEEALNVTFALDGVANRGELLVAVGHVLQALAPLPVERHKVEIIS